MPQHHEGERKQVSRQRLLDVQGRSAQLLRHRRESRQIGVDREWPERGQGSKQEGQLVLGNLHLADYTGGVTWQHQIGVACMSHKAP